MPTMAGYTKLFSSILASTIWRESMEVRIVWITLLAMAGKDGIAEGSVPGVADFARLPVEVTRKALATLSAPDRDSRSQEHQGRRIAPVDGGWLILNHAKYRAKLNADERREYFRLKKREYRRVSTSVQDVQDTGITSTQAEAEAEAEADATKIKPVVRRTHATVEPEAFAEFWNTYPNRKGRQAAVKAWLRVKPDAELVAKMVTALRWQREQPGWKKDKGQYVPMLATWINQRRFEDEPFEAANPADPNRAVWDRLEAKVSNAR